MKKILPCIFLFLSTVISSQEKFSKELSFINDNDLYVSFKRDRYYTNGMFLRFNHLTNTKNDGVSKRIFEWEIGHEMYTPYKIRVASINDHDRPFAGHLYAGFGIKRAYKKNRILTTSAQLGLIGPRAYAEELQEIIHDIYGFEDAIGWEFQIQEALSANVKVDYLHQIMMNEKKSFDISWVNYGRLGTVYTDIESGVYMRFGTSTLASMDNTIAFGTNLNDENTNFTRAVESFFFVEPTFRYAFYDATIEGSFLNDRSPVTKELVPFVFNIKIGFRFTANRFNFGYTFNYNTSKSKDLVYTYGNKFGTIGVSYLFR